MKLRASNPAPPNKTNANATSQNDERARAIFRAPRLRLPREPCFKASFTSVCAASQAGAAPKMTPRDKLKPSEKMHDRPVEMNVDSRAAKSAGARASNAARPQCARINPATPPTMRAKHFR